MSTQIWGFSTNSTKTPSNLQIHLQTWRIKAKLCFNDCRNLKLRIPIRTPSQSHQKRRKIGIEMKSKITWSWIHHCMLDLVRKSPRIMTGRGRNEWKRKRERAASFFEREGVKMTMKRIKSWDIKYFRGNYHFTLLSLYYLHYYFKSLTLNNL